LVLPEDESRRNLNEFCRRNGLKLPRKGSGRKARKQKEA
jgi:hypothetical protein